jgi:hypothetical protein
MNATRESILYSEISSDQYEIVWVKFPEELFHWIYQLREAQKFQEQVKKTCTWDTKKITTLHQLDHQITRIVDFWVHMTLDGYIIEFEADNHQFFSHIE